MEWNGGKKLELTYKGSWICYLEIEPSISGLVVQAKQVDGSVILSGWVVTRTLIIDCFIMFGSLQIIIEFFSCIVGFAAIQEVNSWSCL